jgi:hypothetical protein
MVSLLPEKNPNVTPNVPDETTPGLRPWSTPYLQRLNGAAHATEKLPNDSENTEEGNGPS